MKRSPLMKKRIYLECKDSKEQVISLEDLVKELNLDRK
jgi:hypothetical protein